MNARHLSTQLRKTQSVTRIFVNPAIKKAMCRETGPDRSWLSKVRPWWGHDELGGPPDSIQCKPQPPVAADDGCGHELEIVA